MKKTVLLLFLALTTCYFGYAQSISLADSSGPIANNSIITRPGHANDSEIVSYLFVKNNTSSTLGVKVKKVEISLITGTVNSFCWGVCFPPNIFVSADPVNINAHATDSADFSGHYNPQGFVGISTVRYVFFNAANPTDTVCVNISYNGQPVGIPTQTIKNTLSGAYPNPANNTVNFEYSLNTENTASVVIRNLLGTVVKKSDLSNTETRLSVFTGDLPEGIYFYSLEVDGKTLTTRKLIVKH
jgi:hypothetical protein